MPGRHAYLRAKNMSTTEIPDHLTPLGESHLSPLLTIVTCGASRRGGCKTHHKGVQEISQLCRRFHKGQHPSAQGGATFSSARTFRASASRENPAASPRPGQGVPCRLPVACWTCGREAAPMRFRAADLRRQGWAPPQTLQIPDWCGCSTEYRRCQTARAGGRSCRSGNPRRRRGAVADHCSSGLDGACRNGARANNPLRRWESAVSYWACRSRRAARSRQRPLTTVPHQRGPGPPRGTAKARVSAHSLRVTFDVAQLPAESTGSGGGQLRGGQVDEQG